jgi:hypothetical protein
MRQYQLPLFRPKAGEPTHRPPDTAYIRKNLNRLLRLAREAQILPWSEPEAHQVGERIALLQSWEKLFPELAASLPPEEAETLTSEFRSELARQRSA